MSNNLGNKRTMARNILTHMKRSEVSRTQISKKLHVPYTTVCDWVNAKTYPRIDKIEALADLFSVTKADLVEESTSKNAFVVPVLGDVAAGLPIFVEENIIDYEEISSDMASKGEHFALRVRGESMEPKFSEGDVVIIRQQPDVETGDIAVVLVNGDSATIKKIKKRPDGIMLVPLNSVFEPMFYNNDEIRDLPVQVLGRVVELRAKF